jgi:hypothetical protein
MFCVGGAPPGGGGGTPGGAGGMPAPPEDAHAAVTMQRIFNPPLDRNNDVEASVRHMNTQVDALLHHVSGLQGVPRLTLKPGTQTQWMVDHVGTRVQLTPGILLTVADVRRRDVWDFLTTQLTTAPCLFDQKDPPAAQAYKTPRRSGGGRSGSVAARLAALRHSTPRIMLCFWRRLDAPWGPLPFTDSPCGVLYRTHVPWGSLWCRL